MRSSVLNLALAPLYLMHRYQTEAATKIVGKYGYAEASVARITDEAGVAQGTFYNHFENRQELLD